MSVRARMQDIARDVSKHLPPGHGFFVLCFEFGKAGACEYVSNGQRAEIIEAMKEFIARSPMQEMGRN